jgi:hypothetical protein
MSVVVCSVIHLSRRRGNSCDSASCGSGALSSRRRICRHSVRCSRRRIGRRGACRVVHRIGRHIVQYIYLRSRSDRHKRSGCPCQDGARRRATC